MDSLKSKKCLFVPKPTGVPTPCVVQSSVQNDNGGGTIAFGLVKEMGNEKVGMVESAVHQEGIRLAVKENTVPYVVFSKDLVDVPVLCAYGLSDKAGG